MLFENQQINSADLPKVENLSFVPLERSYLKVAVIGNLIFWAFILIGASLFFFFNVSRLPEILRFLIPAVLISVFLLSIFLVIKGYHKKAYAIRKKDIIYRSGLIWQKETAIPFKRVQHCEVNRGPIERIFDLSTLQVFTAGGSSSDLSIPGLNPETANKIKEFIVKKSIADEEE